MSLYRILLGIAGLIVVFALLALPTSCSQGSQEKYARFQVPCTKTIDVTDTGVNPPDAYICKGDKVTWNANNHVFTVFFKKDCPFGKGNCKEIDNKYPTAGPIVATSSTTPTIYDYGIVVDGNLFDPHIIGGGN